MDKNVLVIVTGRIVQIVISLISVRLFTSLLSLSEVGNLYLIQSLMAFFSLVLLNPIGMYMNRKLHKWAEEGSIINNYAIYNIFLLMVSASSIVVVYSLHHFFHIASGVNMKLLIILIVFYLYINTWNQVIVPTLNLLKHRVSFVIFTTITLITGLCLSSVFVLFIGSTAIHWLSGLVVAQAIVTVVAFRFFRKIIPDRYNFDAIRATINRQNCINVLHFVIPLTITTFFMWLQYQSYRIIIEKNVGLEFLGLIGLGIAISSSIAAAVESVIQQLYLPIFYQKINTYDQEQRTEAWNRMAHLTLPVYISLTILVSCLAPCLVNILASGKFEQAFLFVIYGAWIEMFRMTTNILSSVAHAEMRTRSLIRAYLAGGLLAVAGTYLAAQHHNYQQLIPMVLMMSGFVTTMVMYIDMKRLVRIKVGIRLIRKSVFLSLPFALAIPFYGLPRNLGVSIAIALIFGSYFLITQYRVSKPILEDAARGESH